MLVTITKLEPQMHKTKTKIMKKTMKMKTNLSKRIDKIMKLSKNVA